MGFSDSKSGRILYVQYTNPAVLPPLQHSSRILANNGWEVRFIGADVEGTEELTFPPHENITTYRLSVRPTGWKQKVHYFQYVVQVLRHALTWSPDWVYVSNPLGALVGLLLSGIPGVRVVYHEHDSPSDTSTGSPFMRLVYRARDLLARRAELCILPNEDRVAFFEEVTGRQSETKCVWNTPTQEEVVSYELEMDPDPFYLHYHGSLVPERIPVTVVEALSELPPRVQLRIAGYETSGAKGHSEALRSRARDLGIEDRIELRGTIPRRKLLEWTSRSHVGLSFMPFDTDNVNMKWMTGASNKPFDYMAAGIPMLVCNLPDWKSMFVKPGYARACDPKCPASIAEGVKWYLDQPVKRKSMAEAAHHRIRDEWNYERQFEAVKQFISRK